MIRLSLSLARFSFGTFITLCKTNSCSVWIQRLLVLFVIAVATHAIVDIHFEWDFTFCNGHKPCAHINNAKKHVILRQDLFLKHKSRFRLLGGNLLPGVFGYDFIVVTIASERAGLSMMTPPTPEFEKGL